MSKWPKGGSNHIRLSIQAMNVQLYQRYKQFTCLHYNATQYHRGGLPPKLIQIIKCYFTSIYSWHFKTIEFYWNMEEGTMVGFHYNPLTSSVATLYPPYIVIDREYFLLIWCITAIKMEHVRLCLWKNEVFFNRKHSSMWMNIEQGFDILKAWFKENRTKSSLKLNFQPTVVHCWRILHNMLLTSKN